MLHLAGVSPAMLFNRGLRKPRTDDGASLKQHKVKPQKKEKGPPHLRVLPGPDGNDGDKVLESLESLFEVALKQQGVDRTAQVMDSVAERLRASGIDAPRIVSTPYLNTIPS